MFWCLSFTCKQLKEASFQQLIYDVIMFCQAPVHFAKMQRADEGLTPETSAFQIFHGGNLTVINSFDKTKFSFCQKAELLHIGSSNILFPLQLSYSCQLSQIRNESPGLHCRSPNLPDINNFEPF